MLKGRMPLVIAGVLALLAGFFVWRHIEETKQEIRKGWDLKMIIVAQHDMAEGTLLAIDDVSQREVPEQFVTDSVITPENYNFVLGQKLAYPVKGGDPILWTHFQSSKGFERLSNVVQKKARAVSINVSEQSSVSQYVHPNDHVDIIGTFRDPETRDLLAVTLLQNMIVLATGKITGNTNVNLLDERDRAYTTVTMLALPEEAEILVLAQELGTLYLSLRHSDDISVQDERGRATIKTLLTGERTRDLEKVRFNTIQVIKGQRSDTNAVH
jgi:pilus assembly protein CpaB